MSRSNYNDSDEEWDPEYEGIDPANIVSGPRNRTRVNYNEERFRISRVGDDMRRKYGFHSYVSSVNLDAGKATIRGMGMNGVEVISLSELYDMLGSSERELFMQGGYLEYCIKENIFLPFNRTIAEWAADGVGMLDGWKFVPEEQVEASEEGGGDGEESSSSSSSICTLVDTAVQTSLPVDNSTQTSVQEERVSPLPHRPPVSVDVHSTEVQVSSGGTQTSALEVTSARLPLPPPTAAQLPRCRKLPNPNREVALMGGTQVAATSPVQEQKKKPHSHAVNRLGSAAKASEPPVKKSKNAAGGAVPVTAPRSLPPLPAGGMASLYNPPVHRPPKGDSAAYKRVEAQRKIQAERVDRDKRNKTSTRPNFGVDQTDSGVVTARRLLNTYGTRLCVFGRIGMDQLTPSAGSFVFQQTHVYSVGEIGCLKREEHPACVIHAAFMLEQVKHISDYIRVEWRGMSVDDGQGVFYVPGIPIGQWMTCNWLEEQLKLTLPTADEDVVHASLTPDEMMLQGVISVLENPSVKEILRENEASGKSAASVCRPQSSSHSLLRVFFGK